MDLDWGLIYWSLDLDWGLIYWSLDWHWTWGYIRLYRSLIYWSLDWHWTWSYIRLYWGLMYKRLWLGDRSSSHHLWLWLSYIRSWGLLYKLLRISSLLSNWMSSSKLSWMTEGWLSKSALWGQGSSSWKSSWESSCWSYGSTHHGGIWLHFSIIFYLATVRYYYKF